MLTLCWHKILVYYALKYAGIFDGGLLRNVMENNRFLGWPNSWQTISLHSTGYFDTTITSNSYYLLKLS